MSEIDHGLRYTPEELTKLRPALMSPKAPLQPDFPALDEAVVQAKTSAETIAAPGTKAEVEHQTELAGEPAAVIANENGDNHGHIETANLKIEDSVWSTESQVAAPDNGAPVEVEKKKKKKSSGKKKKPNPTGFEEFYADPPITPEDHKEEVEQLYHQ
jgi:hypothetical protein